MTGEQNYFHVHFFKKILHFTFAVIFEVPNVET